MTDYTTSSVGARIRMLREQRGLSLRALAGRCGLSINAISRIERGESSPTVTSLHLMAMALEVPIAEFFQEAPDQQLVVVRRGQGMRTEQQGFGIQSLGSGLRNQQIEPFLVTLAPGARSASELITHPGQEFAFCLEGVVAYQVREDVIRLEAGDSLILEATQPHAFSNPTETPSRLLIVFQMREGERHTQHLPPRAR